MTLEKAYRRVRSRIRLRDWAQQRPTASTLSPFEMLVLRAKVQERLKQRHEYLSDFNHHRMN